MGLLDYADAARKKLAGLLGDMPLVQIAQGRAEMPTRAGLLGALKSIPVFSPDAGQSAYEAALTIGPMGLGKIVYHGSPHKFDKFDASKIGTGEGAQAYGHGVYLAESPRVAEEYKNKLGKVVSAIDGKPTRDVYEEWAVSALKNYQDPAKAKAYFQNLVDVGLLQGKSPDQMRAYVSEVHGAIDRAAGKQVGQTIDGALYKADLPDEWIPKMLDWDKPLSEQSKEVQAALSDEAAKYIARGAKVPNAGMIVKSMEYLDKETGKFGGPQGIAAKLKESGVTGIRYLDGGSRPNSGRISMLEQTIANLKGKGASQSAIANTQRELDAELARASYNYVVFPGLEDQVKILERNGIPLSGLLGGQ